MRNGGESAGVVRGRISNNLYGGYLRYLYLIACRWVEGFTAGIIKLICGCRYASKNVYMNAFSSSFLVSHKFI